MATIRCPRCVARGKNGIVAVVSEEGNLQLSHRGRKYELGSGATIARVFCEECKQWFEPEVPKGKLRLNESICLTQES